MNNEINIVETLKFLEVCKNKEKKQLEEVLEGHVTFINNEQFTIQKDYKNENGEIRKNTYILKPKGKKLDVTTSYNTMKLNIDISKNKKEYIISIFNRYNSLNHCYYIIKKDYLRE